MGIKLPWTSNKDILSHPHVLGVSFLTLIQASSIQDVVVSYHLQVRRHRRVGVEGSGAVPPVGICGPNMCPSRRQARGSDWLGKRTGHWRGGKGCALVSDVPVSVLALRALGAPGKDKMKMKTKALTRPNMKTVCSARVSVILPVRVAYSSACTPFLLFFILLLTFAHDHVPSPKPSHYRLLSPYLVHSCVSFRSPFFPFLTLPSSRTSRHGPECRSRALEANILEACTNHKLVYSKDENCRASVSIGADYFVKFGDPDALRPELQTRQQTKRKKESPFSGLRVSDSSRC